MVASRVFYCGGGCELLILSPCFMHIRNCGSSSNGATVANCRTNARLLSMSHSQVFPQINIVDGNTFSLARVPNIRLFRGSGTLLSVKVPCNSFLCHQSKKYIVGDSFQGSHIQYQSTDGHSLLTNCRQKPVHDLDAALLCD